MNIINAIEFNNNLYYIYGCTKEMSKEYIVNKIEKYFNMKLDKYYFYKNVVDQEDGRLLFMNKYGDIK